MLKTQRLVGALRVLLALAFGVLLFAQLRVLPASYDDWVRDSPDPVPPQWLLAVGVLDLLCLQAVIVCTWRLLTMVAHDRIFSDDSRAWVDTILVAMAAGWVLLAGALLSVMALGGEARLVSALVLMLIAGAVVGLLMVVMRALLRQATMLRVEMESVV